MISIRSGRKVRSISSIARMPACVSARMPGRGAILGFCGVLVATNVAARGLDVDHVELVVNYELPESPELLTHRVGRTGRMGREGFAYTLVADTDDEQWTKLKRGLKQTIRPLQWEGSGTPSAQPRPALATAGVSRAPRGGGDRYKGPRNARQAPGQPSRNSASSGRQGQGRFRPLPVLRQRADAPETSPQDRDDGGSPW